jgi:AraC family transcriptional regulator
MARSVTDALLQTEQARIHVYTYRYERPSKHTRSPDRDVLALFGNQAPGSAGFFQTAGATSRLLPLGGLMIIPAGTSISAMGPGGDRRLAVCTMTHGILPEDFDPSDQRQLALCSDIRDPNVRNGVQRLAQEAAMPGFASDILVDGLANALRVDLRRYFAGASRQQIETPGSLAPWQFRRIEDFIHGSDGQRLRIADLSTVAEVSPGHLARTFKKTTGRTVREYIEDVRLERAYALLSESTMPLKQVAARLGFGTPSSFTLAFRRATGTTPARYRKAHAVIR